MARRVNRHLLIIREVEPYLRDKGYKVTQFHHHSRMPESLKGVPDLYIARNDVSYWIEIKPRYENYRRDQMKDNQWQWYHDHRNDFGEHLRYAIVENAEEIRMFLLQRETVWVPEYHYQRYENWRRGHR